LPCAIVFCPFGALTHPLSFSFEKEKGDTKNFLIQFFPFSNSIRERELKGVSEN
jgi:hypothetical protein